ncbi:MAG TPA: MAPEG family protein [Candidatus Binataceae bacterium]|nr:MAPEG family protein [Candidatus Binataceae bacterium]
MSISAGVAIVIALALLEYMVLGALVGRARGQYKVDAPATTGNPIFERYFRVHQNTLENLIVFVPAVWLFSQFVNNSLAIALGVIFIAGRIIYAMGYISDPGKRVPGVLISLAVNAILVLGVVIWITIDTV